LARGDDWVVVNKPTRMPVHRSALTGRQPVLLQLLRNQLGQHVYPVHRLDGSTSGCLLVGLSSAAAGRLHLALARGKKTYLALCRGFVQSRDPIRVDQPMKDDQGILKEAATVLRCVASSPDPRCSLLLAEPETGRYHQVRRHCRDLSHPVLGDGEHGDSRVNRAWREGHGLDRLALHAYRLEVEEGGRRLEIIAPLPDDLQRVFRALPWWPEALAALPGLVDSPA
jgi:tRNA pseudouridine65 synthase